MASFSYGVFLFILLIAAANVAALDVATLTDESELDDLDLLELDLEDPEPSSSSSASPSSSSSVVSLAQQKKALIQLSDHTASSFLASQQHVLLLGYTPWCMRSSELMPEFAAAALVLQEAGISISFAKLDGVANQRTASLYGIKGFPSLLLFVNGSDERYTRGFTRYMRIGAHGVMLEIRLLMHWESILRMPLHWLLPR